MIFGDTKFIEDFFNDNCIVAILVSAYAIKLNWNGSWSDAKSMVINKATESGEPLVKVTIGHNDYLDGTVLAHRIFFEWLLTQKME